MRCQLKLSIAVLLLLSACGTKRDVTEDVTTSRRTWFNSSSAAIMRLDLVDTFFTFAPLSDSFHVCTADTPRLIPAVVRRAHMSAQVADTSSRSVSDTTSAIRRVTSKSPPSSKKEWLLFPSWVPWVFSFGSFIFTIIVVFIVIKVVLGSRSL